MDAKIENLKRLIGRRIKAGRESLGMTQEEFSEQLERSVPALSNMERGVSLPPLDVLLKVTELTGQSLSDLVQTAGHEQTNPMSDREIELMNLAAGMPQTDLEILVSLSRLLRSREAASNAIDP